MHYTLYSSFPSHYIPFIFSSARVIFNSLCLVAVATSYITSVCSGTCTLESIAFWLLQLLNSDSRYVDIQSIAQYISCSTRTPAVCIIELLADLPFVLVSTELTLPHPLAHFADCTISYDDPGLQCDAGRAQLYLSVDLDVYSIPYLDGERRAP